MSRESEVNDESRTDTETDDTTEPTDVGDPVREGTDRSANRDRTATVDDVETLRGDVVAFAEEVEDRIVKRNDLESDLKRYVRSQQRRGHARGWGPYLVLLYGTAMTIGAFFYLDGGWAILAMLVVWLSTLGLYALMVLVGVGVAALGAPGRIADLVRDFRS